MYRLEIKPEDGYLHITASGVRTYESVSNLAFETTEACVRHGFGDVLMNICALTGRLSIFDSMRVISKVFPDLRWRSVLKNVVVVDDAKRSERIRFFEQIARSQGYRIKMFGNLDEATSYFLENRQQKTV